MRRTRVVAGLVAAVVLTATGCSSGSAPATSADSTVAAGASPSASSASSPSSPSNSSGDAAPGTVVASADTPATSASASVAPAPGRTPQEVVRGLALTPADVAEGLSVTLYEQGDQVDGQVTLDACGVRFPSEALRVARYQVGVLLPDKQFVMSNENVAYATADDAARALDEYRAAVAACPDDYVPSVLQGQPAMKYTYQPIADADLGTVAPDHLALSAHAETRQGEAFELVVVFQRRGRVLAALYASDLSTLQPSIGVLAGRLADLPPADVGG